MTLSVLTEKIKNGGYDSRFAELYDSVDRARERALVLCREFEKRFGDREGAELFSSPARVELLGNHTDHAGGRALAAAIKEDIMALAAPDKERVALYGEKEVDLILDGKERHEDEQRTSAAFARGMAERFGGGFVGVTNSRIPLGGGLASSAAYALLCAKIADEFHSETKADPMRLALIAADIERNCYGKSCGMLDQIAISYGGTSYISFNTLIPIVKQLNLSFGDYLLYIVNTGETHANKSVLYKGIVDDMTVAANFFGCNMLGQVPPEEFKERGEVLKKRHGERIYRRALHFFDENKRVDFFARMAGAGKTDLALYSINGSGISSRSNLGNVHLRAVEATTALKDVAAGIRIHGGGFGGAMLCFVKPANKTDFEKINSELFGAASLIPVSLRSAGVCKL